MPSTYVFKDHKAAETVARALLFVAKFSKKQALVKFSDSSVSIIWGGSPKTYFIHAEPTALDMFRNKQSTRYGGIDHCTVIQVNPSILGKTLRGGSHDRNVSICVLRPNRIKVTVEYGDTAKRTITHSIPCELKTLDDYKSMLIQEIEKNVCYYDTKSYIDNIHRFKNIIDSYAKLNTPRIYILSKQNHLTNDLIINTRTQASNINVSISDLSQELYREDPSRPRRVEAGVNVDTKKLSFFLSSLVAQKRSKVCFEVEHNKCLKITLDHEIVQGEKFYQSLLLLHNLNC